MSQRMRRQENSDSKVEINQASPTAPIDIKFPSNAKKGDLIHKKQKIKDDRPYMEENYSHLLSHSTPTDAMEHRIFERSIVDNAPPFHLFGINPVRQCNNNERHYLGPLWSRKSRRQTFSGSDISLTDSDIFSIIEGASSEFNKETPYSKENSSLDCSIDLCPPNLKKSKIFSYSPYCDSDGNKSWFQFNNEDGRLSISAPDERVWQRRKQYSSNLGHKCLQSRLTMNKEDIPEKDNEDTSTELANSLSKNYKDYGELKSRTTSESSQSDGSESSEDDSYWLWANYMYSEGQWHS